MPYPHNNFVSPFLLFLRISEPSVNACIICVSLSILLSPAPPPPPPERIRHRLVCFCAKSVNQKMLRFFFRIEFLKHGMSYTEYMLFAFIPIGIYSALLSFMNCVERHVLSLWVCSGIIYNRFFKRLYVRFIFSIL